MERSSVLTLDQAVKSVKRRNKIFLFLSSIFIFILLLILRQITYIDHPWIIDINVISLWLVVTGGFFVLFSLTSRYSTDRYIKSIEKLSDHEKEQDIGGFMVKDIEHYVEEISKKMGIDKEVKVCLMDKTLPNAFGILWRNVICIDKSWMRILDDQELKALIAHELYHLKIKKTRPIFGHPYIMRSVIFLQTAVITAILLFSSGDVFWDIFFFLILFQWVDTFFLIAPMKSSRAEEHLCDWSAIKYTSLEGVLNLMLKMGQRYEAINIIKETISEKANEYKIPIRDYNDIQRRIDKKMTREDITSEGVREVVRETVDELAEERKWKSTLVKVPSWGQKQRFKRATRKHKIDWMEYDTHIEDFKLDREEIPDLVEDLKKDEYSFLFDANIDGPKDSHGTHPTIKNRVLFLWENHSRYSTSDLPSLT